MIEVLALASSVTAISKSISAAVSAGQDVGSLMPSFGKFAKIGAEITAAETGKHKGFLGKLTSTEEEGFAIAQARMAHRKAHNELREVCQLYGPSGMWDMVVHEQAKARTRRKKEIDALAAARDKRTLYLSIAAGVVTFALGLAAIFWGFITLTEI